MTDSAAGSGSDSLCPSPSPSPALAQVQEMGNKAWVHIAKELGTGRSGKQCRERWLNHLRPDLNKGKWSAEEDAALVEAHRAVGNRWSEIAKRIPGRPENAIKNRWNSTLRARGRRGTPPDQELSVPAGEGTPPSKRGARAKSGSPSSMDATHGSEHTEGSPLRAYIQEIMGYPQSRPDIEGLSVEKQIGDGGARGGAVRHGRDAGKTGDGGSPPFRRPARGRPRKRPSWPPTSHPKLAATPKKGRNGAAQADGARTECWAPPPRAERELRSRVVNSPHSGLSVGEEDEAVLVVPQTFTARGELSFGPEGISEEDQTFGGKSSTGGTTVPLEAEFWPPPPPPLSAAPEAMAEGVDRTPPRPRSTLPHAEFLELLQSPTRGFTLMPLTGGLGDDLPMLDMRTLQKSPLHSGLGASDNDEEARGDSTSPRQLSWGLLQDAPAQRATDRPPPDGEASPTSAADAGASADDALEVTEGPLDVGECVQGVSSGLPVYNEVASAVACANGTLFQYDEGFLDPGLGMSVQPSVVRERMVQVAREMRARWDLGRVSIAFRYSRVEYNDPYLCIAASARVWAFAREAVQFARDRLAPGAAQYHQLFNQQLHAGAGGESCLLDLVS